MRNLRKLGAAVVLTFLLTLSAFAGQIPTPPCAPGQVDTPPCSSAPGDMETPSLTSTSGDTGTPTVANDETYSKIVADVLLNLLPLF